MFFMERENMAQILRFKSEVSWLLVDMAGVRQ